jgi:hypothetical protein
MFLFITFNINQHSTGIFSLIFAANIQNNEAANQKGH